MEPWYPDKHGLGYEREWVGGVLWLAYEEENNPRRWHWVRESQDRSVLYEGHLSHAMYGPFDTEEAMAAAERYEGKI